MITIERDKQYQSFSNVNENVVCTEGRKGWKKTKIGSEDQDEMVAILR